MIIKTDAYYRIIYIGIVLLQIVGIMYMLLNSIVEMPFIMVMILLDIYLLLMFPVMWHILYLDEKGCSFKLWKYERNYVWEEIKIKRMDYYKCERPHHEIVFFSVNHVKKPKRLDPMTYCMLFHPFTCFCIYLTPPKEERYPAMCAVEKDLFLRKMEEWNIEIQQGD